MPVTIDDMLRAATQAARRIMEKDGSLSAPIWVLFRTDGEIIPVSTPFPARDGSLAKQLALAWLRNKIRVEQPIGYTIASEAWMSQRPTEVGDPAGAKAQVESEYAAGRRPSTDPDRIDCLIVAAVTPKARRATVFRILRDARGRFGGLEEFTTLDPDPGVEFAGRFLELFDRQD